MTHELTPHAERFLQRAGAIIPLEQTETGDMSEVSTAVMSVLCSLFPKCVLRLMSPKGRKQQIFKITNGRMRLWLVDLRREFLFASPSTKGNIMREWVRFFAGTPRRFLATVIGCFLLGGMLFPERAVGGLKTLVAGVWNEVFVPLFQALLPVVLLVSIVVFGFRTMFRGFGGKKKP